MGLTELWRTSRDQLKEKHVQQIIAFAGDGRLKDGSPASAEFRDFLSNVPSKILERYADECLQDSFKESGLALQDIVNQVGERLGFKVTDGRYRGTSKYIGFDGLWRFPDGHAVVVEVKTSDAYRIDLNKIAGYRRDLVTQGKIKEEHSSILIVVGRKDTGDLEAQIRGSRHAWDMRLISVDALLKLMSLKENMEDPKIVRRIYDILIPREFTKLDEIIDILFSAAEEVKPEELPGDQEVDKETGVKPAPMAFHEACVVRMEKHLERTLIRRSRTGYSSPDEELAIVCTVSKEHKIREHISYWFAFHPHQKEFLTQATDRFVAFGCGSEATLLFIPLADFEQWLDDMWTTEKDGRIYWHVRIHIENSHLLLDRRKGKGRLDVTHYLLK